MVTFLKLTTLLGVAQICCQGGRVHIPQLRTDGIDQGLAVIPPFVGAKDGVVARVVDPLANSSQCGAKLALTTPSWRMPG